MRLWKSHPLITVLVIVIFGIFAVPNVYANDINYTGPNDPNLPQNLQGKLNDAQIELINKTKELNPSSDKFNPMLFQALINIAPPLPAAGTNLPVTGTPGNNVVLDGSGLDTSINAGTELDNSEGPRSTGITPGDSGPVRFQFPGDGKVVDLTGESSEVQTKAFFARLFGGAFDVRDPNEMRSTGGCFSTSKLTPTNFNDSTNIFDIRTSTFGVGSPTREISSPTGDSPNVPLMVTDGNLLRDLRTLGANNRQVLDGINTQVHGQGVAFTGERAQ